METTVILDEKSDAGHARLPVCGTTCLSLVHVLQGLSSAQQLVYTAPNAEVVDQHVSQDSSAIDYEVCSAIRDSSVTDVPV